MKMLLAAGRAVVDTATLNEFISIEFLNEH